MAGNWSNEQIIQEVQTKMYASLWKIFAKILSNGFRRCFSPFVKKKTTFDCCCQVGISTLRTCCHQGAFYSVWEQSLWSWKDPQTSQTLLCIPLTAEILIILGRCLQSLEQTCIEGHSRDTCWISSCRLSLPDRKTGKRQCKYQDVKLTSCYSQKKTLIVRNNIINI